MAEIITGTYRGMKAEITGFPCRADQSRYEVVLTLEGPGVHEHRTYHVSRPMWEWIRLTASGQQIAVLEQVAALERHQPQPAAPAPGQPEQQPGGEA